MARSKYDHVKIALADLVFEATKSALTEANRGHVSAAQSPLGDCLLEIVPISELEATVIVTGQGKPRFFSVKVHEQSLGSHA
jgi:hypothetical protein